VIAKEIKYFLFLFFFLALSMHFKAWIDHPIEHIKALKNSSLGIYHPLFLSFGIFILIALLRISYFLCKKLRLKSP